MERGMSPNRVLYGCSGDHFAEVAAVFAARGVPFILERAGSTGELFRRLQQEPAYAAVLFDLELGELGGLRALQLVAATRYPAALLLLSGQGDMQAAETALAAGAVDFIVRRPGYAQALPRILLEALQTYQLRQKAQDAARRTSEQDM